MTSKQNSNTHNLPSPGEDAVNHSHQVRDFLLKCVADSSAADATGQSQKRLSLGEFMHYALYQPGLGYYASGLQKFGEQGDFVTAPELGSVFAKCTARAAQRVLSQLDSGTVFELGAGSGQLAHDVLLELDRLDSLPERYAILEISASLIARQRALLATLPVHIHERIEWLDRPPLANFDGLLLANEVVDALPVERFRLEQNNQMMMDYVTNVEGRLACVQDIATPEVATCVQQLLEQVGPRNAPYTGEVRTGLHDWLASVSQRLNKGAMLFVDYGEGARSLYSAQRCHGSLLCHYRHRAHDDVLLWPGLQDITAWVNFTALADAAVAQGWDFDGYTTQAHYLIDCGLDEVVNRSYEKADTREQVKIAAQVRQLTMPGEMGERFKAIAFRRGLEHGIFSENCTGFEHRL